MSFNFHIMGLFVIYMLMCIYFFNYDALKNRNHMFRYLLFTNFICQFLYLIGFIVLNQGFNTFISVWFIKLFFASLLVCVSILFGYIYSKVIKNKYIGKDTLFEKKVRVLSRGLIILDLVLVALSFILPISINDIIVSGDAVRYTYIVSFIFVVLSLFTMFINIKDVDKKDYIKLYIPVLVSLIILVIQYCSSKFGVLASGYTFVILFIYITLESDASYEISYLKLAKENAERVSCEKTEFLEKISREIRTPLNTIDGFSQVIMDEDNIDNIKEDVRDIRVASNNLVDLINGIMDITLIESGNMEIHNHDYDTMEMLESLSMMAKTLIGKKNIDFKVEYSDNIPKVLYGDNEKIKRVVINLLRNAVTYTANGYITFKVSAVRSGDKCRLIMSVSDTGKGIKKEELNTIFNRYERVGRDSSSNGLGLAIVENLVNLMNGKVDVDSEVGKGSTFTVTIDQKVILEESISISNEETLKVKTFDASGMRIMVVDDNKLNLKVATRLLMPYGVEVVQAASGKEFLDIMDKDHDFDLILMDDMMPNMSGTETLEVFRKIERVDGYSIPVVVLTANAISGMREKYLKAGFDDYLSKPIDKYELNRVLKRYLKRVEKDNLGDSSLEELNIVNTSYSRHKLSNNRIEKFKQ